MSGPGCLPASIGITRHITVINAENAACPKRQAAFLFSKKANWKHSSKRGKTMKKIYFDIHRAILLPSWEANADKPFNEVINKAE